MVLARENGTAKPTRTTVTHCEKRLLCSFDLKHRHHERIQTIYVDEVALDEDKLKYKENVLQCFRLIDSCDINPNDSQLEKHLENCKKTPFSIETQATLNKLGDFLQNVSIPEEEPVTLA